MGAHSSHRHPSAAGYAALSCPTASIGEPAPALKQAVLPHPALPHVLVCGYASRESYGAQSWLLLRPEGDVLVDVPRPAPALLDRIDGQGGVRHIVRTHRFDVHEHEQIAARFGADRIMHEADSTATSCGSAATTWGVEARGWAPVARSAGTPGPNRPDRWRPSGSTGSPMSCQATEGPGTAGMRRGRRRSPG